MQIVAWLLINQTEQLILKNRSLKDTTKALLKGPKNDLKKKSETRDQKLSQLLTWLKLAKVVHWNFLVIVNKRQKPKLSWKWTSGQF